MSNSVRRGRRRNNGRISERQRKNLLLIYMRNTGRVNTENTSMASVVHPFNEHSVGEHPGRSDIWLLPSAGKIRRDVFIMAGQGL